VVVAYFFLGHPVGCRGKEAVEWMSSVYMLQTSGHIISMF